MKLVRGGYAPPAVALHEPYDSSAGLAGTTTQVYEVLEIPIEHGPLHMSFFHDSRPGLFVISSLHFLEPDGSPRVDKIHPPVDVRAGDILVAVCGLGVGGREDRAVQSMLLQSNEQRHRCVAACAHMRGVCPFFLFSSRCVVVVAAVVVG